MKDQSSVLERTSDIRQQPRVTHARVHDRSPQRFNLWMTTCHPDSADACAGDVVCVPTEFAQRTVLVDLHEVRRIDSWGIALFMEAMQRISSRGGNLVLIRVHEDLRRILETAKLDRVFHICSTYEEALSEFGPQSPL